MRTHFSKFLVILAVVLVVAVLVMTRPQQAVTLKQPVIQAVEPITAIKTDVRPFEKIIGRLEPVRKTALHFEVDGIVSQKLVKPGQLVAQDQPLLLLDEADLKDRYNEAESQLQQEKAAAERDQQLLALAEKNVTLARNEVARLRNLGKKSLVSQSVLDDARQRLAQLESEKANLQFAINTADQRYRQRLAQRDTAARNLQRAALLAPYDGRVNAVMFEVGDRVTPGNKAVDFIDDSAFEIRMQVSRQVVSELSEGMTISLKIDARVFEGKVTEFQRDPDPQTFTHEVRIELDGQNHLSGTLASVDLPLAPAMGVVAVPLSAVLLDDGENSVFVIKVDKLEKRAVKLGIRHNDLQVISAGLLPGELVVARDVSALADQQQVKTTPASVQ